MVNSTVDNEVRYYFAVLPPSSHRPVTRSLSEELNTLVSEPVMLEERIHRLEVEIGNLSSAQERSRHEFRHEIHELFAAMNNRFDQLMVQKNAEQSENSVRQPKEQRTSSTS